MLYHTEGIVLQSLRFSDTSIIVKIFTQKLGLQSYLVKGVSGKKSSMKMNYFQPLRLLDLVTYQKENVQLNSIKEVKPIHPQHGIYSDIFKTSISLFLAEVLQKTLRETLSDDELFYFLKSQLITLDEQMPLNMNFHLQFMYHLSCFLGFEPQHNYSEENCIFSLRDGCFVPLYIQNRDVNFYGSVQLSKHFHEFLASADYACANQTRKELLNLLMRYFQIHFPNFTSIKSYEVLQDLF